MRVEVAGHCCAGAGSGPNEDALGWTGSPAFGAAWVIDGATGVGERDWITGAASDAQWYAGCLNAALTARSLEAGAPKTVFRAVIGRVAAAYAESLAGPVASVPRHALPSASAAWVRWAPDEGIVFGALGDCKALYRPFGHGAEVLGPRTGRTSDDRVNRAVRQLQAQGLADAAAYRAKLEGDLRANRDRMNTPDGYWVFSIHPEAADQLDEDRRCPDGPAELLLMTDGFFRLVDTYGAYDLDRLMDVAGTSGFDPLLAELRDIERGDPDCRRFPRLKPADDAAALHLRVELD